MDHFCQVEKNGITMKAVLEDDDAVQGNQTKPERTVMFKRSEEKPSFLKEIMGTGMKKIGMVNMEIDDEWKKYGQIVPIHFEKVSEYFEWKHLFPEWIDEEEEIDGPMCPEIPMPDFDKYRSLDMIVAEIPCNKSNSKYQGNEEEGWRRDVFGLQVHLIVANLAVKTGNKGLLNMRRTRTKVVFLSKCSRPMPELFRCDDLLKQEGNWWYFEPNLDRLHHKISLPVGSCNLALPLWGKGTQKHPHIFYIQFLQKVFISRAR